MPTLAFWLIAAGLLWLWSYLCFRIGLSLAAVSVNEMIKEGKLIVVP